VIHKNHDNDTFPESRVFSPFATDKLPKFHFRVVSLSCCDALHSILETGVRWYAVGQGTLPAPDTRATHPSSRHDLSDLLPSLGSRVAMYAVSQLHGSAPALVTVLASSGVVAPDDNTPMTTIIVSQTTSGPWRTRSCVALTADAHIGFQGRGM
jgi:hypothetical protein